MLASAVGASACSGVAPSSAEGEPADTSADDGSGTDGNPGADEPLRVATWNVENLGLADAQDLAYARDVATRVDADVLCLQEVLEEEASLFASFLSDVYPYRIQGEVGDKLGGSQTVACLSKLEILESESVSAPEASTDSSAADIGRELIWLRVLLADGRGVSLVAVHLKSGPDGVDQFRRAVEMIRLLGWVDGVQDLHPDESFVVLGDFNVRPDDPANGMAFTDFPPGLPATYVLGDDISFPIVYDPLADMAGAGFDLVDATLASSTSTSTHRPTLWRLDYVFVAPARSGDQADAPTVRGALVYDACRDDVDPPVPLSGAPLPCLTTETASDHWPVVVDLVP